MTSLTSIDVVASGKRQRSISMFQIHYFPASAYAASRTLLEETGVKYRLVPVE
jgi:hypothetical protein